MNKLMKTVLVTFLALVQFLGGSISSYLIGYYKADDVAHAVTQRQAFI